MVYMLSTKHHHGVALNLILVLLFFTNACVVVEDPVVNETTQIHQENNVQIGISPACNTPACNTNDMSIVSSKLDEGISNDMISDATLMQDAISTTEMLQDQSIPIVVTLPDMMTDTLDMQPIVVDMAEMIVDMNTVMTPATGKCGEPYTVINTMMISEDTCNRNNDDLSICDSNGYPELVYEFIVSDGGCHIQLGQGILFTYSSSVCTNQGGSCFSGLENITINNVGQRVSVALEHEDGCGLITGSITCR